MRVESPTKDSRRLPSCFYGSARGEAPVTSALCLGFCLKKQPRKKNTQRNAGSKVTVFFFRSSIRFHNIPNII